MQAGWAQAGGQGWAGAATPAEQVYRVWLLYRWSLRRYGNGWLPWRPNTAERCGLVVSGPRFKVTAINGGEIRPEEQGLGGRMLGPTFSVLDTAVCHREVAAFSATSSRQSIAFELRRAETLAASLNADPMFA